MSFNQDLQKEINIWQQEDLISPDVANTLRQRYPVTKRSMTQTLAVLGSILIGIGVILFFAANWQYMSQSLKVIVVVLSFTLAYGSGYYLKYVKGTYPKVGTALIFLGSILYGSSIWLIAQIFHLEAEAGMGFFLWYLGVIPAAYLFNSSLHLALAGVNLAAWFLAGKYPLGLPFLVFPLLLFGTILPLSIMKKDKINFTGACIAAYIWFIPLGVKLAHINFSFPLGMVSLLLLSLLLYFLVRLLEGKEFFAYNFLLTISLLGLFVGFAPFTFHGFLQEFTEKIVLHQFFYLVLGSLAVLILFKIWKGKTSLLDLPLLLLFLVSFPFYPALGDSMAILIMNNLLFFLFTLLSIYYGYIIKLPLIFNLSILMFAAAVIMKYFDIFFALLPRSVFFMSGGFLLLIGSLLLEYKRRDLLKTMERGESS